MAYIYRKWRKTIYHHIVISLIILMSLSRCQDTSNNSEVNVDDLDLREANVVQVEYNLQTSQFDVTLIHDDDGETGYADWWQVESLDGTVFGRRDLTHAHGTQEFTRSYTIVIPDGNDYVVIRGHDQTHEYGGQAIVFNIVENKQDRIRQGTEAIDFSNYPDY